MGLVARAGTAAAIVVMLNMILQFGSRRVGFSFWTMGTRKGALRFTVVVVAVTLVAFVAFVAFVAVVAVVAVVAFVAVVAAAVAAAAVAAASVRLQ